MYLQNANASVCNCVCVCGRTEPNRTEHNPNPLEFCWIPISNLIVSYYVTQFYNIFLYSVRCRLLASVCGLWLCGGEFNTPFSRTRRPSIKLKISRR